MHAMMHCIDVRINSVKNLRSTSIIKILWNQLKFLISEIVRFKFFFMSLSHAHELAFCCKFHIPDCFDGVMIRASFLNALGVGSILDRIIQKTSKIFHSFHVWH